MERPVREKTPADIASFTQFILSLTVLWLACAFVLWWAYDMSASVAEGAYDRRSALSSVAQFSCILTGLVGIVWMRWRRKATEVRTWKSAWTVCWQTAVILFLYALAVEVRRQTWSPTRGEGDWAMFYGGLNARFFCEAGPFSFALIVLPSIAGISAALFFLQSGFIRKP
jgi:hypothetical protein